MKTIKEWITDIHNNAVDKGWWEKERSFGEIIALCHSELSEALEADRGGESAVWDNSGKPEGWAVELADCVIRIFDYFGKQGIDAEKIIADKHEFNKTRPYKHNKRY